MKLGRREFVATTVGAGAYALFASTETVIGGSKMYGLIGSMTAVEGKRDALIQILLDGVSGMPGCLSYVVAKDPKDANGVWITEVWGNKESHARIVEAPIRTSRDRKRQTTHRKVRIVQRDRTSRRTRN